MTLQKFTQQCLLVYRGQLCKFPMANGAHISNFFPIMTFLGGQSITKIKHILFSPARVVEEEASKIVLSD